MKIEKKKLLEFISRYNLDGNVESVALSYSKKNKLSINYKAEDKSYLFTIDLLNVDLGSEDFKFGVHTTSNLKSLINSLSSAIEIEIDFEEKNDIKHQLALSHNGMLIRYNLADLSIVNQGGSLTKDIDYELNLDLGFIDNFLEAYKALKSQTFMIQTDVLTKKVNIVLSEDSDPTTNFKGNQAIINVAHKGNLDVDITGLYYDTALFKSILSANKANSYITSSTMKVSSKGLMELSFSNNDINSVYYLVAKNIGS